MNQAPNPSTEHYQEDVALAASICRSILDGSPEALEVLYLRYHKVLQKFIAKRVFDPTLREDMLQHFWYTLLDGKIICEYDAQTGISLEGYLKRRMAFRILDALRRERRYRQRFPELPCVSNAGEEAPSTGIERLPEAVQTTQSEQTEWFDRSLLYEALDILSETRPEDVRLIRDQLSGKSYDEMAAERWTGPPEHLQRKSTALRQQVCRARLRLKLIIERLMENSR